MHLEVAEHLIGLATYAVTSRALSFTEEDRMPLAFAIRHCVGVAAGKFIERCIRIDLSEFKFSDGAPKHREVDWASRGHLREKCAKEFADRSEFR